MMLWWVRSTLHQWVFETSGLTVGMASSDYRMPMQLLSMQADNTTSFQHAFSDSGVGILGTASLLPSRQLRLMDDC